MDWPNGTSINSAQKPVDALRYAVQMFGRGYTDVVIVDLSEDGKAYSLADFIWMQEDSGGSW
jgi:hypothetical protein